MKIITDKKYFLDAILPATGFTSNRSTIAATEGILLRTTDNMTVDIVAYDLEKGMKTSLTCQVEEEGSAVINALKLIQIIRTMPDGAITLEVDEKTMRTRISCKKSKFELQAQTGANFPDIPELRGDKGLSVRHSDLKRMLQKTTFAIAVNNARPELNGLNLSVKGDILKAVSCDGSRLAIYSEKCEMENVGTSELDFDIIIPGKTIGEVQKFIQDSEEKVIINVARKHTVFFIGDFIIFTRLIDAKYVEYERFLPKAPKIFVSLDTAEFTSSLERSMLVTEEKNQGQIKSPVVCRFADGMLTVASSSVTGRVNDEILIEQEGEAIEIGFNCRFLYDAMRVCDSERVRLSLTSPLMGITIEPSEKKENKEFLLLVLPVRLNK